MARERKFTDEHLFKETKELIIHDGYEAFTFSKLASRLGVSRGSLYKYYDNKDELISEFLMYEMARFLSDFDKLNKSSDFQTQFNELIDFIFAHNNIYEILDIIGQIPAPTTKRALNNKSRISEYYISMYQQFEGFIELGRKEGLIKEHLPTAVLLGMIFQIIAIPNHFNIPEGEWVASIKEILSSGMFKVDSLTGK
ncbi:TetR/AcrR family transcriptional regulator [Psychrobacillus sp. MER TA 171]|uniref:TetR/AcrR family transcriptional regulator n=1 Tax=Psychrobacillus sp. MER TA 171 TaxID=2939577 RepID=UPI00203E64B4|nr:TetR/AcrR family transcriptional regulator [Psychrobacillus sp. MER TA 171]MCM3357923.1 TetR/AcrR family transcriptional regulator [Psychrobacillus sp. MER TA 171]